MKNVFCASGLRVGQKLSEEGASIQSWPEAGEKQCRHARRGVRAIKEISKQSLRSLVGYVTQEAFLFNGTIRENLPLGKPSALESEIEFAIRAANVKPFIDRLPSGLENQRRRTPYQTKCRRETADFDRSKYPARSSNPGTR